jgi:hypothetical protein
MFLKLKPSEGRARIAALAARTAAALIVLAPMSLGHGPPKAAPRDATIRQAVNGLEKGQIAVSAGIYRRPH